MLSCVVLLGGWKEDWARTRAPRGVGGMFQLQYATMSVPLHTPITICYMSIFFPFIFWLLYKRKDREIWQTVVGAA